MTQLELFPIGAFVINGTVLKQSQTRTARAKLERAAREDYHRDRGVTAAAILDQLYRASHSLSRRELCHGMQREKSPHLIQLVEHLVSDGLVTKLEGSWRGRVMYYYEPNRAIERPEWSYL